MSYKGKTNVKTPDFVEWSVDYDADLSYLTQTCFEGVDRAEVRSFQFQAIHVEHPYTEQERHDVLDSLGGVDYIDPNVSIFEGRVYSVEQANRLQAEGQMESYQHELTVEALQVEVDR